MANRGTKNMTNIVMQYSNVPYVSAARQSTLNSRAMQTMGLKHDETAAPAAGPSSVEARVAERHLIRARGVVKRARSLRDGARNADKTMRAKCEKAVREAEDEVIRLETVKGKELEKAEKKAEAREREKAEKMARRERAMGVRK